MNALEQRYVYAKRLGTGKCYYCAQSDPIGVAVIRGTAFHVHSGPAHRRAGGEVNAREVVDTYASGTVETETEYGVFEPVVRENAAPEAIAALRDVLDLCDTGDKDSIGILDTRDVRAAIAAALPLEAK